MLTRSLIPKVQAMMAQTTPPFDSVRALPDAYLVDLFDPSIDGDSLIFASADDAKRCAEEQAQAAFDAGQEWQEWPIVPLSRERP